MSHPEFTLQEIVLLLQRADSMAKLMLSIDHGQVTDLHGSLYGLRCILDQAIRSLESIPDQTTGHVHSVDGPTAS